MCKIDSAKPKEGRGVARGVARGGVAFGYIRKRKFDGNMKYYNANCQLTLYRFVPFSILNLIFLRFPFFVFLDSIYRFAYMILPYMI